MLNAKTKKSYRPKYLLKEFKICRQFSEIIKKHKAIAPGQVFDARNIETSEGISLSEEQIGAINSVLNAPVSAITGGPGSGKTTLVQGLVSALKTLKADLRLCAPTGRAPKRIAETPGLAEFFHQPFINSSQNN